MTKLSVIVVSFNAPEIVECCLGSLEQQMLQPGVEVLVVRAWNNLEQSDRETLQCRFKNVHWVDAPVLSTVPKMRSLGLSSSQGEIVAFLEDDCVVPPLWCDAVLLAHQQIPNVAIGGAVEPSNYPSSLDWGVYFCEYVRFMQPFVGDVSALPGNNVSYKRTGLQLRLNQAHEDGFYEVFVNQALQDSGQILKADAGMFVHNVNSWKFSNISNVPFHHGRGFAGMRLAGKSWLQRLPYLGLALVLPLIQVGRITTQVLSRQRYVFRLLQALPGIVMFSLSWSLGEFVGYLRGSGDSLQQWR